MRGLLTAGTWGEDVLPGILALGVTDADFLATAYRATFAAIVATYQRGRPHHPAVVALQLEQDGTLDCLPWVQVDADPSDRRADARAWLEAESDLCVSAAGIEQWAREVRAVARLRQIASVSSRLADEAMGRDADPDAVITAGIETLSALAPRADQRSRWVGQVVVDDFDRFADFLDAPDKLRGFPCGLPSLDFALNGFEPGRLILPAAATSHGKSLFMLRVARGLAERGARVLYVTLEMTAEQAKNRLVFARAGIAESALRRQGNTTAEQRERLLEAHEWVSKLGILLDSGNEDWYAIRSRIDQAVSRDGVQVVFVDHVDLVQFARQDRENRHSQIAAITSGMKNLALKHDIPIIAATQVNRQRASSDRKSKIPTLSDLRESGTKEENADIVLILHRPAQELVQQNRRPHPEDVVWHEFKCFVAKNRDGETPGLDFYVDVPTQRLEEIKR